MPSGVRAWFTGLIIVVELPGALAIAQGREGHRRPDRAVRVLAAVLAHARDVAPDVAGVEIRPVEGRIEKLDQRVVAAHEALVDGVHRHPRALGIARAREHRPALRNGVDPALDVARRSQRRAVVEVRAPIPLAVPAVLLEVLAQLDRLRLAALGERRVALQLRDLGELLQHVHRGRSPARRFRPRP